MSAEVDRDVPIHHDVLMVYRDVSIHAEGATDAHRPDPVYTVSVDEKPGVQALGLTAPDLPPVPGKARAIGRDYEYVRHGTVSILAGIDLHSGHIFAAVTGMVPVPARCLRPAAPAQPGHA